MKCPVIIKIKLSIETTKAGGFQLALRIVSMVVSDIIILVEISVYVSLSTKSAWKQVSQTSYYANKILDVRKEEKKNKLFNSERRLTSLIMKSKAIEASFTSWMEVFAECAGRVNGLGSKIPLPILPEEYLLSICDQAIEILKEHPTVVHLQGPIRIVGDIHGSLHDMLRIFFHAELPTQANYLFLGDYVDRGQFSLEVISLLLTLFVTNPDKVTLLRGNHETREVNSIYGFRAELIHVYGSSNLFEKFNEVFDYLPLSAIVNDEIACFHGGISPDLHDMNQILSIQKPIIDTSTTLVRNLLWSDPKNSCSYFGESERKGAVSFGIFAQRNFLKDTNMNLIIRAHQCVPNGYDRIGNCITVFSASNYINFNQSAALVINKDKEIKIAQFDPLDRKLNRENTLFYNIVVSKPRDSVSVLSKHPLALRTISPWNESKKIASGRNIPNTKSLSRKITFKFNSDGHIKLMKRFGTDKSIKFQTFSLQ